MPTEHISHFTADIDACAEPIGHSPQMQDRQILRFLLEISYRNHRQKNIETAKLTRAARTASPIKIWSVPNSGTWTVLDLFLFVLSLLTFAFFLTLSTCDRNCCHGATLCCVPILVHNQRGETARRASTTGHGIATR